MKKRRSHTITHTCPSIVLLLVLILQVGIKAFHLHAHAETARHECPDCEHHRVHDGHIISWEEGHSDCLVCQLFSAPYQKGMDLVLPNMAAPSPAHSICQTEDIPRMAQMHLIPRAPPAFLL